MAGEALTIGEDDGKCFGREGQVITAALATTGAKADEHLLQEVLEDRSRHAGLPVREVVADAKYAILANYVFLDSTWRRAKAI